MSIYYRYYNFGITNGIVKKKKETQIYYFIEQTKLIRYYETIEYGIASPIHSIYGVFH